MQVLCIAADGKLTLLLLLTWYNSRRVMLKWALLGVGNWGVGIKGVNECLFYFMQPIRRLREFNAGPVRNSYSKRSKELSEDWRRRKENSNIKDIWASLVRRWWEEKGSLPLVLEDDKSWRRTCEVIYYCDLNMHTIFLVRLFAGTLWGLLNPIHGSGEPFLRLEMMRSRGGFSLL